MKGLKQQQGNGSGAAKETKGGSDEKKWKATAGRDETNGEGMEEIGSAK